MQRLTRADIAEIRTQNATAPPRAQNPAIDELADEIDELRHDKRAEIERLQARIRLLTLERNEWRDIARDAVKARNQ